MLYLSGWLRLDNLSSLDWIGKSIRLPINSSVYSYLMGFRLEGMERNTTVYILECLLISGTHK
jgi:hypothetical protein